MIQLGETRGIFLRPLLLVDRLFDVAERICGRLRRRRGVGIVYRETAVLCWIPLFVFLPRALMYDICGVLRSALDLA